MWLADEEARRTVAGGVERWSVQPAMDARAAPTALKHLSREARTALEQQIAVAPWAFAASTSLVPSRAPCFGPDGLTPRPVVLRLFLMHDGAAWRIMQGGLGRVLAPGEHVTETLPTGALFKDVWVLSEDSGDIEGPGPAPPAQVTLRRSMGYLPSRVADDFYWLGRYVERLEAQARLARAGLLRRARGAPLPREMVELQVLTRCLRASGMAMAETGLPIEQQIRRSLLRDGADRAGPGRCRAPDRGAARPHDRRDARRVQPCAAGGAGRRGRGGRRRRGRHGACHGRAAAAGDHGGGGGGRGHGARRRPPVPRSRPPHRAGDGRGLRPRHGVRPAGRAHGRHAAPGAGAVRQRDHLSLALPERAAAGSGAGSGAGRHRQPARAGVPVRGSGGAAGRRRRCGARRRWRAAGRERWPGWWTTCCAVRRPRRRGAARCATRCCRRPTAPPSCPTGSRGASSPCCRRCNRWGSRPHEP